MPSPTQSGPPAPGFGRVSAEHAQTFIGIMHTLHSEPTATAFGRLLKKNLQADDYMLLAHVFEEISVLTLHHLIPEALLFDAFAFDLYWDELREDILAATGRLFRASNKQQYVCRCVGATTPDPGPGGPGRPGIVLAADRPASRPGLPAGGGDAGGPERGRGCRPGGLHQGVAEAAAVAGRRPFPESLVPLDRRE